jgi:hypothetical protein
MGVGIVAAIVAFLVVGAFTGEVVVHAKEAGLFPGLVAAAWCIWPAMHVGGANRYNFLHPVPRRYSQPLKQAFAKVRQILSDKTYNFGDKWHVTSADTMQHRITATLRFTDEESHVEGSNLSNIHTRKERVQRLLELDVQFKEEGDKTVVQLDFRPRVEGVAWYACDSIVSGLVSEIEASMGEGTDAGDPASTTLPAPPWWLLGVTALMLLSLWSSINKSLFGAS